MSCACLAIHGREVHLFLTARTDGGVLDPVIDTTVVGPDSYETNTAVNPTGAFSEDATGVETAATEPGIGALVGKVLTEERVGIVLTEAAVGKKLFGSY